MSRIIPGEFSSVPKESLSGGESSSEFAIVAAIDDAKDRLGTNYGLSDAEFVTFLSKRMRELEEQLMLCDTRRLKALEDMRRLEKTIRQSGAMRAVAEQDEIDRGVEAFVECTEERDRLRAVMDRNNDITIQRLKDENTALKNSNDERCVELQTTIRIQQRELDSLYQRLPKPPLDGLPWGALPHEQAHRLIEGVREAVADLRGGSSWPDDARKVAAELEKHIGEVVLGGEEVAMRLFKKHGPEVG